MRLHGHVFDVFGLLGLLGLIVVLCGAGCTGPDSQLANADLVGSWQVVNGTRRMDCPDRQVSAPFSAQVWFLGGEGEPLRRVDGLSSCEFRFGTMGENRSTGAGEGAQILPGQVCWEVTLDGEGRLWERQSLPVSWTIRRFGGDYLWESYELLVIESHGDLVRTCRIQAAATLARVNPERGDPTQ